MKFDTFKKFNEHDVTQPKHEPKLRENKNQLPFSHHRFRHLTQKKKV